MAEERVYKTDEATRARVAAYKARKRAKKAAAHRAPKTASTSAERMRRLRQRERLAADPVRAFLTGVVTERDAAVKGGYDAAWHHTSVMKATELLGKLTVAREPAINMGHLYWTTGAETSAERDELHSVHEAAWEKHQRRQEALTGRQRQSAMVEEAINVVIYAEQARADGKATSPSTTAGLGAAAKVIERRTAPESEVAYQAWTSELSTAALFKWQSIAHLGTEDEDIFLTYAAVYEDAYEAIEDPA